MIVTCDSALVTGYGMIADMDPASEEPTSSLKIDAFKCGDKLRIEQNKYRIVVLI